MKPKLDVNALSSMFLFSGLTLLLLQYASKTESKTREEIATYKSNLQTTGIVFVGASLIVQSFIGKTKKA